MKETFFFKKILVKKLIPSAFPTIIVQLFQGRNLVKIITLELFHLTYPAIPSHPLTTPQPFAAVGRSIKRGRFPLDTIANFNY